MHDIEFLIGLLAAVALLARLAGLLQVPYPILLVLGGLVLGFVPGTPELRLDPELVFVLFLPPLLYVAAFFSSSVADLRANVRPISLLAVGLVLVTILAVAVVARLAIDDLPWAAAFVLGAILAPTDPLAATAVFRRVGVPDHILTIVEGESLVNDGTGLVAYRLATAAVVTGTFSVLDAAGAFLLVGTAGVVVGLAIGWVAAHVRRRLDDAPVEIAISLLTPYGAYIAAEQLGVSGVLAVVTTGVYLAWLSPGLFLPGTRLQAFAFWDVLEFLLNGLLFVLVGLQFPTILEGISEHSAAGLVALAALVSATVIGVRMLWMFTVPDLVRLVDPRRRRQEGRLPWAERVLVGWSGMRGAISLAAALALPVHTQAGAAFPHRDLILFITFSVILVTLVIEGLTLPLLVRRLGLSDPEAGNRAEAEARVKAAHAAIARMEELAARESLPEETVDHLRGLYDYRLHRYSRALGHAAEDGLPAERSAAYERLRRELIEAERAAVLRLRDEGQIASDVMRRIERDLDLEESRLVG